MTSTGEPSPVDRLRFPEPVAIREVWQREDYDFTPWLAENLQALDLLQLGRLELVGKEVTLPGTGRALDIQARTPTGAVVAIENQFGKADHDHLTRGLAYSVGLQAAALVVVAEEHLGEFRAVASYLNHVAETSASDDVIRVYLVEVSVEAVGEYLVPRFQLVESPNEWLKAVSESGGSSGHATIDEFLSACKPEAAGAFREVIEWWTAQTGGSARYGATLSMTLDRPHPKRSRPLSHMLLNANGTYTIQRGFLRDAEIVGPDRLDAFDVMVRREFPDLGWTGKQYFLNSTRPPTLASVQEYWHWIVNETDTRLAGAAVDMTFGS